MHLAFPQMGKRFQSIFILHFEQKLQLQSICLHVFFRPGPPYFILLSHVHLMFCLDLFGAILEFLSQRFRKKAAIWIFSAGPEVMEPILQKLRPAKQVRWNNTAHV